MYKTYTKQFKYQIHTKIFPTNRFLNPRETLFNLFVAPKRKPSTLNMEKQKQEHEEEKMANPNPNPILDTEIPMKNQTKTTWKNLGLLEILENYDGKMKRRGELILKIVRDFFLTQNAAAAVEQDKGRDSTNSGVQEKHEMEMEMKCTKETPMSKALRNPLVVRKIIGYLSWSSILTSRRVNKLWLPLCTELLQKARDEDFKADGFRICFRYCEETGTLVKAWDGVVGGEIKTLDSFNDYLTQLDPAACSGFPCKNFEFKDLVLRQYQIQRFFRLQGAEIRGLRLYFCREGRSVTMESLTNLLMISCPNIECLYIAKMPSIWQSAENGGQISNSPCFSLAHLKCLLVDLYQVRKEFKTLLTDIVLSSPALQKIHFKNKIVSLDLNESNFDYLTSISKAHLVSHVTARPEMGTLDGLKTFAQSRLKPRLDNLCLYLEFVHCTAVGWAEGSISFETFLPFASALLDSSKESLESLYILKARGGSVSKLLQLQEGAGGIPTLKNVRQVGLSWKERKGQFGRPLPVPGFNRIFPNAQQLLIAGDCETRGLKTSRLKSKAKANAHGGEMSGKIETKLETGVVPQITRLSVQNAFTKDFWINLPSLFCNVQELVVINENLVPVIPLIWQLGRTGTGSGLRLKKLDLQIHLKITNVPLDQVSPALVFPGLDAAFTGFPEEACLQLLSMYPEILDDEIVEEIRINSSILDLKYLEELHIKFLIPSDDELPQNVLTVVSGAYAFERMKQEQQLKVYIQTELYPGYNQTTSFLAAKNQRMENALKPLEPFADILLTMDQF